MNFKNKIGKWTDRREIALHCCKAYGCKWKDWPTHTNSKAVWDSLLPLCFRKSQFGGDQTLPVFWRLLLGPFMTISIPLTFFKLLSPSSTHLILPPNSRTYHIFNPFLLLAVHWTFNFYVHPRSAKLFYIHSIVSCFVSITHACGPTAHA